MKVISFNANGIRSAAQKGFYDWLNQQQADFVCIQETKAQTEQLLSHGSFFPESYTCVYVDAQKKGYSGVAIYAKEAPQHIIQDIGFDFCDQEGRYLQFNYPGLSVISLYLPSGTSGEARQQVKFSCLQFIQEHFTQLKQEGRELIICGDYNIAHKPIDLKNWRSNQKNSGFLPEERAWLDHLFDQIGFVDAFRVVNQSPDEYTWWSHRGQARQNNVGWRIDYQIITPGLQQCVRSASIYRDTLFSDHAPLIIEYAFPMPTNTGPDHA